MRHIILYMLLCSLFLFSCNNMPDHAKYIPNDAQLVVAIDMKQMGKKLIWNALTGSELFEEMQRNMGNEESKKAMKDISNIGLNQQSSVYLYMNRNREKQTSCCIVAGMKDVAAFEAFLKKTYPGINPEKGDGYSSILIEHNMLAAWNTEAALFFPLQAHFGSDSNYVSIDLNEADSLKKNLHAAFAIAGKGSLASNTRFKSLQKAGHDINVWLNYEQIYTNNADPLSNPFIKQEYFKEAALATGINFEKGKAEAVMDYYMSKDMAAIYKKHEPKNINLDLIRKIPSTHIDMMAGYNLNPLMLQEYFKKFGLDGLLNMGLGLAGTSMEQIAGTFNGDLIFTISDMNMKTVTDTIDYDENADRSPAMNMTLAMRIQDETGLEKLLGIGVKNKMLTKNGHVYNLPDAGSNASVAYDKHMMVYSTDTAIISGYMAGKGNGKSMLPESVWRHFSTSPMVMYIDLKNVLLTVPLTTRSDEEKAFIDEAKTFFNYMELYGGKMKNNAVHVEGAMVLSNESENALIQLLNLGMKAKKMKDATAAKVPPMDSALIQ